MKLLLLREPLFSDDGTFGRLSGVGLPPLYTVEDDWKDNRRRESCIREGTYPLRRTMYHKHNYETFEVAEVPGRSRILIHPANTEEDVEGCIGVGLRQGRLWVHDEDQPGHPLVEKRAVVESQTAFRRFMAWMTGIDEAELEIRWEARHV